MPDLKTPLLWALAVLLALSMSGNAALGWAWLDARDALAVSTTERDNARGAASACSDATDDLRDQADRRAAEARTAQAKARAVAARHEQLAQAILATPAAVPGDDCGSTRVRIDAWLQGRAAP
jgi:hypothetical protein